MLLKAVQDNGIFERNKIPLETKVLYCLSALFIWTILSLHDPTDGDDTCLLPLRPLLGSEAEKHDI